MTQKFPQLPESMLAYIARSLTHLRIREMNKVLQQIVDSKKDRSKLKRKSNVLESTSGSKVPRAEKQLKQHLNL